MGHCMALRTSRDTATPDTGADPAREARTLTSPSTTTSPHRRPASCLHRSTDIYTPTLPSHPLHQSLPARLRSRRSSTPSIHRNFPSIERMVTQRTSSCSRYFSWETGVCSFPPPLPPSTSTSSASQAHKNYAHDLPSSNMHPWLRYAPVAPTMPSLLSTVLSLTVRPRDCDTGVLPWACLGVLWRNDAMRR